jgi:hypothetical protein
MPETPNKHTPETDETNALLAEVIAQWSTERLHHSRRNRNDWYRSIGILMGSGIGFGIARTYLERVSPMLSLVAQFVCAFVFLIGAVCFVNYRSAAYWLPSILRQMRRFDDVRTLPYELQAYGWYGGKDEANIASITSLLLRLKPNDASLMKPHLSRIVSFLTENRLREVNHDRRWLRVILAGLTALKNVGDNSVIPAVEKVAEMKAVTGNEARVVVFAKDCLQTLRNRAEQQTISQTLLRPANSLREEGELLRAAISTEQNSDELLRAPQFSGD